MVDFTTAQISGDAQSAVGVHAPVESPSLAGPLSVATSAFKQKEVNDKAARKLAAADAEQGVVGRYVTDMAVLADAVEGGNMKPEEGSARARALLTQTLANSPQSSKAILSASSSFSSSGLGKVITEGNFQVQMERDLIEEAAADNFVQPYMDETQVQEGLANHRAMQSFMAAQEAKRDAISLESAEIGLQESRAAQNLRIGRAGASEVKFQAGVSSAVTNAASAQLNLSSAQRKQQEANIETQQQGSLAEFADLSYFPTKARIEQIYQDVANGRMAPEVAEQRLLSVRADIGHTTTQLGKNLDKGKVDHLASPLNQLLDTAIKNVSSDNRTKLLEDAVKRTKAMSISNATQREPRLTEVWALTSMLGPNNSAIIGATGPIARDFLTSNGSTTGNPANLTEDQSGKSDGVTAYLEFVKGGMVKLNQPRPEDGKPANPEEVAGHVTNILAGTAKYNGSVNSLVEIKRTIDYYASPEFSEYMFENKGHVDPAVRAAAASTITKRIKDELAPAVKEDFTKAMSTQTGMGTFGTTTVGVNAGDVELQVRGNQVLFVGQPQKTGTVMKEHRDPEAIAANLNKKYSAALTKTILAEANLSGTTFAESFTNLEPFLVPDEAVAPPTQEEEVESAVSELMADPDIIEAGLTEEQVRAAVMGEVK